MPTDCPTCTALRKALESLYADLAERVLMTQPVAPGGQQVGPRYYQAPSVTRYARDEIGPLVQRLGALLTATRPAAPQELCRMIEAETPDCITHDARCDWVECTGWRCPVSGQIVKIHLPVGTPDPREASPAAPSPQEPKA